jgi:hypothetical protein
VGGDGDPPCVLANRRWGPTYIAVHIQRREPWAGLAIKNPPKKPHLKKNHRKVGFFWVFLVFFGFEEKKFNFFRIIPFFTQ